MKREDAVAIVIKGLSLHASHDKIVHALCESTGMTWTDAEKFVQQVESEHGHKIAARESPLMAVISIFITLAGITLIVYGAMSILSYFHIMQAPDTSLPLFELTHPGINTVKGVASRAIIDIIIAFFNTIVGRFVMAGIGVLIAIGGIIGLQKAVKSWLKDK